MKSKITAFINDLISYDYLLFGMVFTLFVLFIILSIVLRRRLGLALVFILLSFTILLVGPTYGYAKMHAILFKNSTQLLSEKKLQFSEAVVVHGSLTNDSKKNFKSCKVTASAYAISANKLKNFVKSFKPLQHTSIVIEDIAVSQTRMFKIIIEPFRYSQKYKILLRADCK